MHSIERVLDIFILCGLASHLHMSHAPNDRSTSTYLRPSSISQIIHTTAPPISSSYHEDNQALFNPHARPIPHSASRAPYQDLCTIATSPSIHAQTSIAGKPIVATYPPHHRPATISHLNLLLTNSHIYLSRSQENQ